MVASIHLIGSVPSKYKIVGEIKHFGFNKFSYYD